MTPLGGMSLGLGTTARPATLSAALHLSVADEWGDTGGIEAPADVEITAGGDGLDIDVDLPAPLPDVGIHLGP